MDASKTAALRSLRILLISFTLPILLLWQPVAAQDAGLSDAGLAVANAINQVRVENGLEPLAVHPLLNQAAQGHVDDMLTNYIYGHYGSDGSTVHMRVARTGYSDTPWVSENWVSSGSVDGAMRWWMNDYIHRVNILTPRWREVGIGVGSRGSEMIFVTVFSAGEGAVGEAVNLDVPAEPPSVYIEQEAVPAEGLDYTVRPGDTLLAIGLRYGLPWEDIAAANGLDETSLLQIGQVLRIPGSGEAAVAAAPVPDVPTEPYAVQPGDTLFSIAAQHAMTWQELAALNQLGEHSILQIDQEIKVPASAPEMEEATTADVAEPLRVAATTAATVTVSNPLTDTGMGATAAVLAAHTASVEAQASLGEPEISRSALDGVPVTAPAAPAEAAVAAVSSGVGGPVALGASGDGRFYTIAEGDTLFTVAFAQGLDWQELMALNGMSESSILQPGQKIRLR